MTDRVFEETVDEVDDPGPDRAVLGPTLPVAETTIESGFARDRTTLLLGLLEFALLAGIVVVALILRFWGIRWGTGYYLHPDELFMTSVLVNVSAPSGFWEYLDTATSPLNPFNTGTGYIYGTFPLFATKFLGSFTEYTTVDVAHIPGRWLSAIIDTGTVVLVWWIGRMLWNRWTGLLAALLLAFTALNIGASHYFTTDSWSAFFATGAFAFVLAAWKYRRWSLYAIAGLMVGLATASKPNMLAAVGFLALPVLEAIRVNGWRALLPRWSNLDDDDQRSFPVLLASALSVLVAIWTIRLAQPYMFEGPSLFSFRFDPRWLADVEFWRNAQSGEMDYYPSHQWTERAPIVFHLRNMVLWGMGPGLGLAALAGFAWQVWKIVVARTWPSWLMLGLTGWIGFHILYFGTALAKTQRYWLPAYPLLVVLAAAVIVSSLQWAWNRDVVRIPGFSWSLRFPRWCNPALILPVLVVATTIFYGTAYVAIFANTQTRVDASEWIVDNVPDGSTIANEYWDLGLPVGIESLAGHYWEMVNLDLYGDENQQKLTTLIGQLQRTEYIVLSSGRLRDSIPRMPWRYPMTTRYYEALYSGELGFDEVAHFTSFPELLGIEFDDRSAEETLTVYDHPEVTIFRKSDRWDAHAAWYLLDDALGHGGLSIRPVQTQPDRMMLDEADQEQVRSHSSWGSIFDPGSITNKLPVVFWYLALQILVLPMVPVLWRLFPWLPDRGYATSKTIGLFAVSWIAWWLSSLRLLDFGVVAIGIAWLAILAVGGLILRANAPRIVSDLRQAWRWIVATEALLLCGYIAAVWARSQNSDLWIPGRIGTQFQNIATFNAMSLTPFFPAYDPWLVDGTIHDFTFGYMPWAVLTRVSGILPESAYSLSLATMAALVIVNAWMGACVLIARFRRAEGTWQTIVSGLLAPILLIGIGSWGMAQRVGSGDWGPNFAGSVRNAVDGLWTTISSNPTVPAGAWLSTDSFVGPGTLEFPLLSYLTGEMAIQQLAMPLFLAGFVVLLGFLSRGDSPASDEPTVMASFDGWRGAISFLIPIGLVNGWTFAANPLFGVALMGLTGGLIFLAAGARHQWNSSWVTLRDSGVALVTIGATAGISVAPFISSYGYFATMRTPLTQAISVDDYVGHLGVLFAVTVSYVLWQLWGLGGFTHETGGLGWPALIGSGALVLIMLGLAFVLGNLAIFLMAFLLLAGIVTWYRHDDVRHLLLLGPVLAAIVLSVIANRMLFARWSMQQNIPLQFSLVTWMLLAVVAAPIVVIALSAAWERASVLRMGGKRTFSIAWAIAIAVLVGAGAVYPGLGFPQRSDDRLVQTSTTLDSFAFMENGQLALDANNGQVEPYDLSSDLAAVEWMRDHLIGLPTILEAPGTMPGWAGRISALTGFPTVIGQTPVENQQRPGMDRLVNWRFVDVTEVFGGEGSFSEIEPILQDYGVQIIYVGALERATYPAAALAKFDQAVADGVLEVLYQNEDVTIYHYGGTRDSQEPHDP